MCTSELTRPENRTDINFDTDRLTMFPSRQYKRVSQNSDSEDEVTLYAAPLNGTGSGDDEAFGAGTYNRDLRLNLHSPTHLQDKIKERRSERRHLLYSALFCAAVLVIVLGLGIMIIVYAQVYLKPVTEGPTQTTTDPLCVQPPPPLTNKANGCKGVTSKPSSPDSTPNSNSEDSVSTAGNQGEATDPPDSKTDNVSPDPKTTNEEVTTRTPLEDTSGTDGLTEDSDPTQTPTDYLCVQPPPPLANKTNGCVGTAPSDSTTQGSHSSTTSSEGTDTVSTGRRNEDHTVTLPSLTPTQEEDHTVTPPSLTPTQEEDHTVTPPSLTPTQEEDHIVTPPSLTPTQEENLTITPPSLPLTKGVDWTREFFPAATECTLQLYDMNRDGVLDLVTTKVFNRCALKILAMDGITGRTVWETEVDFPVFALRCELDVNQDGVMDCIASGRTGGFTALNGVDGAVLWVVDAEITFPGYNFFFPLIVDDLDSDGVSDLINIHGGDSTYHPSVKDRSPGFLFAVSGRTGVKLMDPILTPDGRESYMSPVLFKVEGKFELILFGTGGETVSGSLWAVSMDSIRTRILKSKFSKADERVNPDYPCPITKEELNAIRPAFNKTAFDFTRKVTSKDNDYLRFCPKVGGRSPIWNVYEICLYEILRSKSKGVLLPPVILDLNADSVDDLLVTTFDNHYTAYDGKDLTTVLWHSYYPNSESYSVPAPLFYSEDFFPDLLVRANEGEWDDYHLSSLYLIDGRDGSQLWSFDSTYSGMMSAISVAADSHGQDAMLFITIGEMDESIPETNLSDDKVDSNVKPESDRERRHGVDSPHSEDEDDPPLPEEPNELWTSTSKDHFPDPVEDLDGFLRYCGHSLRGLSANLYLVDRAMVESGLEIKPIATERPFVFKGSLLDFANSSGLLFKRQANDFSSSNDQLPSSFSTSFPNGAHPPGEAPEYDDNYDPRNGNENLSPDLNSKGNNGFEDDNFTLVMSKGFRCSHIMAPIMIVTTPTIGDVDGDGKLEVSYTVVWSSPGDSMDGRQVPPKMKVSTFTMEDKFNEVYGEGVIDFRQFLPPEKQPWPRYMGATADCVYHPQHNLRDTRGQRS